MQNFTADLFQGLGEERPPDRFFVPDTHLNNPLTRIKADELLVRWKASREATALKDLNPASTPPSPHAHVGIFLWLRSLHSRQPVAEVSWEKTIQVLGSDFFRCLSKADLLPSSALPASLTSFKLTPFSRLLFVLREDLHDAVLFSASLQLPTKTGRNTKIFKLEGLTIQIIRDYVLWEWSGYFWISDHPFLLMVSDLINQRFLSFAASSLYEHLDSPVFIPERSLQLLYDWGDAILAAKGNDGYNAIKLWEALCTSELHSRSTVVEVGSPEAFKAAMRNELDTLLAEYGLTSRSDDLFFKLGELLPTPGHLSQAFGFFRHWGHPFVFTPEGIKKNRLVAEPPKVLKLKALDRLEASFKKMICEGFYKKYSKYPELDLSSLSSTSSLKQKLLSGQVIMEATPHPDWVKVKGKPTFDRGYGLNLLGILGDKACSLPLTPLTSALANFKKGDWKSRRSLYAFLQDDLTSAADLLTRLDQEGLTEEDLVIGVTPKERELKIKPRLFSLMAPNLKYYFGLTEALLADQVLPLIPETTMVDDALTVLKKQYNVTKGMGKRAVEVPVAINIDFASWNLNFRQETTQASFAFLDELFGFDSLLQNTHRYFKRCLFYCADGHHWPLVHNGKIVENDLAWRNQEGGCEGLRQKGWTLVTIAGLKCILSAHGVKFRILGQGDNQVLVLYFRLTDVDFAGRPTLQSFQAIGRRFKIIFQELIDFFEDLGLPIKAEETWSSSSLFAYGKFLIFEGVPLPMSLKKIARCFPLVNDDYPSLSESISSIFTNALAAGGVDHSFVVPYLCALGEARFGIEKSLAYSILVDKPLLDAAKDRAKRSEHKDLPSAAYLMAPKRAGDVAMKLLTGASCVGGPPVLSPIDFLSKGFPDPLSTYLTWANILVRYSDLQPVREAAKHWSSPVLEAETDLTMVIQDPTAINVRTAIRKESLLKRFTKKVLENQSIVKNPLVSKLVEFLKKDESELINVLSKTTPFNPRFLSDLHGATAMGQGKMVVGRFVSTKTIRTLARTLDIQMTDDIRKAECDSLIYWIFQSENSGAYSSPEIERACVGRKAQLLREEGWKRTDIRGVTVPHPLHYMRRSNAIGGTCALCALNSDYLLIRMAEEVLDDPSLLTTKLGPVPPYFGSETAEKIPQAKDYLIKHADSSLNLALRICSVINWFVDADDPLADVITNILGSLTDMPPEYAIGAIIDVTGHWIHRYRDRLTKHGGFCNMLYSALSYLLSSTNTLGKYSKGGKNYPMHIQEMMVSIQHLTATSWIYSKEVTAENLTQHWHVLCSECLPELADEKISAPESVRGYQPPSGRDISGLWVPFERIQKSLIARAPQNLYYRINMSDLEYRSSLKFFYVLLAKETARRIHILSKSQDPATVDDMLPVVWCFNADPSMLFPLVLTYLRVLLLKDQLYETLYVTSTSAFKNSTDSDLSGWMASLPFYCFSPLIPLLVHPPTRKLLATLPWGELPPGPTLSWSRACYSIRSFFVGFSPYRLVAPQDDAFCFSDSSYSDVFLSRALLQSLNLSESEFAPAILAIRFIGRACRRKELSGQQCTRDFVESAITATIGMRFSRGGVSVTSSTTCVMLRNCARSPVFYCTLDHAIKQLAPTSLREPSFLPPMDSSAFSELPEGGMSETVIIRELSRVHESSCDSYQIEKSPVIHQGPLLQSVTPTLSGLKWASLFRNFNTRVPSGVLVSLSDASGGCSAVWLKMNPGNRVVYHSFIQSMDSVPHSFGSYLPPELGNIPNVESRLIRFEQLFASSSNLLRPEGWESLSRRTMDVDVGMVTCDAELGWGNHGEMLDLASKAVAWSSIFHPSAPLALKFYLTTPAVELSVLAIFVSAYTQVRVFSSNFSSLDSREAFIIGSNPLKESKLSFHRNDDVCVVKSVRIPNSRTNLLDRRRDEVDVSSISTQYLNYIDRPYPERYRVAVLRLLSHLPVLKEPYTLSEVQHTLVFRLSEFLRHPVYGTKVLGTQKPPKRAVFGSSLIDKYLGLHISLRLVRAARRGALRSEVSLVRRGVSLVIAPSDILAFTTHLKMPGDEVQRGSTVIPAKSIPDRSPFVKEFTKLLAFLPER